LLGGLGTSGRRLATGLMSALLDGGEVEGRGGLVDREGFVLDHPEKSLKTGVLDRIGGRTAKHDDPPRSSHLAQTPFEPTKIRRVLLLTFNHARMWRH
jgi:hypothetical protein